MKWISQIVLPAAVILAQLGRAADPLSIWEQRASGTANNLNGITYGKGQFVVVGDFGTIVTSTSGSNWILRASGSTKALYGAAWGRSQFVAVGTSGTILTSTNGVDWFPSESGTSNQLSAVSFVNDQFVAVGVSGTILASQDGLNWTMRDSGTNGFLVLTSVAYGAGRFVAAGSALKSGTYSAALVASLDGLEWNRIDYMTNATVILGMTFGNDYFVVVEFTNGSGDGTIMTSPDGDNWSAVVSVAGAALNGIAYAEGHFVAVGSKRNQSVMITSPGGSVWTTRSAGSPTWLNAIAYGNGHFVAVGLAGAITESQSFVRLEADWSLSSGGVQFKLTGPSGQDCLIQASTNFISWDALTNAVLNNGSAQFADPSAANFSTRFYRAVLQ